MWNKIIDPLTGKKHNIDSGIGQNILNNYQNIVKQGLSAWHLREMTNPELKGLRETLVYMTKHFIDDEQYEKCVVLQKELEKIEAILEQV